MLPKVPIIVPIIISQLMGKKHSKVSIYIPKVKNSKGKLVPTAAKGKYWYVYVYFRHPITKKLNYKYTVKGNINTYKTVQERKKQARLVKKALEELIDNGFTPFEKFEETIDPNSKFISTEDAIKLAVKTKKKQWNETTIGSMISHIEAFIRFLERKKIYDIDIKDISKKHISEFLNNLNVKNKTRNNYRATLSSIFSQMVADGLLQYNVVATIPVLKVKPNKNKAFTKEQIKNIHDYLTKNDTYLLQYLHFVTYAFLRPIEVNRLRVGDIDLINNRIYARNTKTRTRETILIISKLKETIESMGIHKYDSNLFLFTKNKKPDQWKTKKEKQRQEWFMKRFRKVKNHFNLSNDYSIYSFRHTFALNLYHSFLKDNLTDLEAKHKLMTITRHKSLSGLENYLRDIGAFVPADYSKDFTINF